MSNVSRGKQKMSTRLRRGVLPSVPCYGTLYRGLAVAGAIALPVERKKKVMKK